MRRVLALVVLTVAALCAATAQAAPHPSSVGFELTPAGQRPYPQFTAAAGTTVHGAIRLHSRSRRPQVVRLQALDLVTANLGGIEFHPGSPRQTGSWLRLARRDVRLTPGARRTVPFTARVPAGTVTGQHFAGIVALDRAELRRAAARPAGKHPGVVLQRVTRLALPVRVTVPGPAPAKLDLHGIDFAANAGGSRLDVDLRSTGRRLVRSTAVDLRVETPGGKPLFRHRGTMAEFIPHTEARYPLKWQGRLTEGRYRVVGTISPQGAPVIRVDAPVAFTHARANKLEQQTGVQPPPAGGPPLLLVAALGAAVLFGGALSVAYARLRRRLSAAQSARSSTG